MCSRCLRLRLTRIAGQLPSLIRGALTWFLRRGALGRDRAVAGRSVSEASQGEDAPVVEVSLAGQRRRSACGACRPRAARTPPLYLIRKSLIS